MPGTHVAIRTRTERAGDANEVKVLHGTSTGPNLLLRHATQPEERLEEVDQTDPAGRYRSYVNGDVWYFQRAASASWATATTLWQADANGVTFSIPQTFTVNDATANDVTAVLTLNHNTTGTPATSLGTRLAFGIETSTTVSTTAGLIDVLWTTVTHATRTSDMVFSVVVSAVTTEFLRLDGSASEIVIAQDVRLATGKAIRTSTTATNTLLLQAYDVDGGAYTTFITLTAANTPTLTINAFTIGGAVAGGDQAFTNVGDMTFAAGSILASGSTNGNTLLLRANDTTFITLTTGATDVCTMDAITMSGTWLASGTVTLPAFSMGGDLNMVSASNRIGSGTTDLAISGALNAAASLGTRIDAAANGVWVTVYEINNVDEVGVANIKMSWYGVTPVIQQAGIINADGTLADITTKFNTLLAALEAYGLLAVA